MRAVILMSAGLALAGAPGAVCGLIVHALLTRRTAAQRREQPLRPVLLLLVVELRSGSSVLGAFQAVAAAFPSNREVTQAARIATIAGLTAAVGSVEGPLRNVLSQLARAQRSGAPLAETVRAMIEADIASEKATRLARARTVPVRLMVPITLLVLPGLVLLFYAPSMLRLFEELSGPLS